MRSRKMIRITYLNDNNPGQVCEGEHGFCCLVESDVQFLFDTGPSDIAIRNSRKLGIDPDQVPMIVLSHGHSDHTGGLPYLSGKMLICHPDALTPKYRKKEGAWLGVPLPVNEILEKFDVITAIHPYWLSDNVVFLGEIPRLTHFESQTTTFSKPDGSDDFMPDDSGVALLSDSGLVVISGCAHSGIVNMVEYARQVTGEGRVHAVAGGFHLNEKDQVTRLTAEALKNLGVKRIIPSHCTATAAKDVFGERWEIPDIHSGSVVVIQ